MGTVLVFSTTATKRARENLALGVLDFAKGTDWSVQVIEFDGSPFPIRDLLKFWAPIGCIVDTSGAGLKPTDIKTKEFGNTPVVYFENASLITPRGATCVIHDAAAAGRIAAQEFMLLNLPNCAFLGRQDQTWSKRRQDGFASALKLNGRDIAVFNLIPDNKNIHQLTGWLEKLPKPCGLFAASDVLGVTALSTCVQRGISVPYDMAIIGFDNDELVCESTKPTLTSITTDFKQAGRFAARLLARKIAAKTNVKEETLYAVSGIIRRGSTRLLKRRDDCVANAIERIWAPDGIYLSPMEITAAFPCSRRSAEIRFRQATGHSILDELLKARLNLAKELLSCSKLSVAAIAERCGYSAIAHFRNVFSKATGMNPLTWRKTQQ